MFGKIEKVAPANTYSKLDILLFSLFVIVYIPLSVWIHLTHHYYPHILIMVFIGFLYLLFECIQLCSPLIGAILGGAIPLLIFGPSLFIEPWNQAVEGILVSVPIGGQVGFIISEICLWVKNGKNGSQKSILSLLKRPWTPYVSLLVLLTILSYLIDPFYVSVLFPVFAIPILTSFLYIVYRIFADNRNNASAIFINLSYLPLLIIGSHLLLFMFGGWFNEEGGYWILYALIILCLPLAIIFRVIGMIIRKAHRTA